MGCRDAKTIQEALKVAASYRIGPKQEARILAFYNKYKPWIDQYRGGLSALSVAEGIIHESGGDPLSTADPKIEEAGLWSLTRGVTEKADVDPFDPEANLWAACRLRNERIKEALGLYPWLKDADPYDYDKITGIPGSIGQGGWKLIMKKVFPKEPTGEARKRPYAHLRGWVEKNGQQLAMGRMSAPLVVCRVMRTQSTDWLKRKGGLPVPGVYKLIPKPSHLPRFNAAVYQAIWKTAKKLRPQKFAAYLKRVPGAALAGGGGVLLALGLAGGGYLLHRWLKRRKGARR